MQPMLSATVRPPVVEDGSAERFLLGTLLAGGMNPRESGVIAIVGGPGSGKSTALAVAERELTAISGVRYVDEPRRSLVEELSRSGPVVYTATRPCGVQTERVLRLQTWGMDEFIEYLKPRGREVCARVLARVSSDAAFARLEGSAVLCAAVLDELASGPVDADVGQVIERLCREECNDPRVFRRACAAAGRLLLSFRESEADAAESTRILSRGVLRLRPVRQWLAAKWMAGGIEEHSAEVNQVRSDVVPWVVELVGEMLTRDSALCDLLAADFGEGKGLRAAFAASLLHAAQRPVHPRGRVDLSTAFLPGIDLTARDLAGIGLASAKLGGARLDDTKLKGADLRDATLDRASLRRADLAQSRLRLASLRGADLRLARIEGADLCRANLSNAVLDGVRGAGADVVQTDLSGASLVRAGLRNARFVECDVERANFSWARMPKAIFRRTCLRTAALCGCELTEAVVDDCAMAGVALDGCNCAAVRFSSCDLYGSRMRRAALSGASFVSCGLAHIDWQGADLHDAKFIQCSFHAGSSRSGLVGSFLASEGTRTGFYTDEFDTRDQRPPEEIRTANLCECDLRGAEFGSLDFYLVDLRGAMYTQWQEAWFRKCRAILGRL